MATQLDYCFRIATEAAFAADLNAFCAGYGYAPLSADGQTVADVVFEGVARFNFDIFEIIIPAVYSVAPSPGNPGTITTPADDRGLHVNARALVLPSVDQVAGAAALAALDTNLRGFFATLPTMTNTAPAAYPGAGGQQWHTTPGGTTLIDPAPTVRKRTWA